jgi:hypothetical protein
LLGRLAGLVAEVESVVVEEVLRELHSVSSRYGGMTVKPLEKR